MHSEEQSATLFPVKFVLFLTYFLLAAMIINFAFGLVAILVSYITRQAVDNTYLASHVEWLKETFWISMLFFGVSVGLGSINMQFSNFVFETLPKIIQNSVVLHTHTLYWCIAAAWFLWFAWFAHRFLYGLAMLLLSKEAPKIHWHFFPNARFQKKQSAEPEHKAWF